MEENNQAEEATVDVNAIMEHTAEIVSAHVGNNPVAPHDVPELIKSVHKALTGMSTPKEEKKVELVPAVPIRRSIQPDYLVCLEDGKKLKMLKRHLMTSYNMTPDEYRDKWGLARDYPMVAPNYAEQRSALAKQIGLGQKAGAAKGGRKRS